MGREPVPRKIIPSDDSNGSSDSGMPIANADVLSPVIADYPDGNDQPDLERIEGQARRRSLGDFVNNDEKEYVKSMTARNLLADKATRERRRSRKDSGAAYEVGSMFGTERNMKEDPTDRSLALTRRGSNFFHSMGGQHEANVDAKYLTKRRQRLAAILESPPFLLTSVTITFMALYCKDISDAMMSGASGTETVDWISFILFLMFTAEMILESYGREGYFNGFYFWLDFIGTLSLIPDISFIWPDSLSLNGLLVARASRAARSGTRSTRIIRIIRVLRILRLLKLPKLLAKTRRRKQHENKALEQRSQLGDRHAEVVGSRVVVLVIIMLIVLPFLENSPVDRAQTTGFDIIQELIDSEASPDSVNRSCHKFVRTHIDFEIEFELIYLKVALNKSTSRDAGELIYSIPERYHKNVVSLGDIEPNWQNGLKWSSLEAQFDMTRHISKDAEMSIQLTSFIVFLFVGGAFVFSRDAHRLIVEPIQRVTSVTKGLAGSLFSLDDENVVGVESAYIEGVLQKLSRFFDVKKHKRTTIYTSKDDVWKIDVRHEIETVARGAGSSHRLTPADLHNLRNSKQKQLVQTLMFKDFLADPQAVRYFRNYLAKVNAVDLLRIWENIEEFHNLHAEAARLAETIFTKFVKEGEGANVFPLAPDQFSDDKRTQLSVDVTSGKPERTCFQSLHDAVIEALRSVHFGKFVDSDKFSGLMTVKSGLPMAIMVEKEFGDETKKG